MVKCSNKRDVMLVFVKIELYIVMIILSILTIIYMVSIIQVTIDIIRMAILAVFLVLTLYVWYKITLKLLRKLQKV